MKQKTPKIFHLLPNAHLDPVWLWDWREGLNEGITTVQTVLNLMDEYPDLTFLRGEAAIYRHIQKFAPDLFRRIRQKIEQGRWDVVGGTWVQPDSNLASTETLCGHFERALAYFEKELGVRPRVAWQADSFGHTAGWPNILHSFGMKGFAFTRPQRKEFAMKSPLFHWRGDHGNRLLCYRQHGMWYCSERSNVPDILDETLAACQTQPWQNVGVLIGLGNHGGGPTRKHLEDVERWRAKHPEIELRYSTLHGLFHALEKEIAGEAGTKVPEVHGEFGYCLRGCYSSVQKFKALYRRTEQALTGAGIAQAMIGGTELPAEAWETILFNSFHDILPGTSIERAMEEQMASTGMVFHQSQKAGFEAMNILAEKVDTRVPKPATPDAPTLVPVLVWNPLPRPYSGPVEIEISLDYRPLFHFRNRANELPVGLFDDGGKALPFQEIDTEHSSMPEFPWRKRVVTHLDVPALGWQVVRMGVVTKKVAQPKPANSSFSVKGGIAGNDWKITVNGGALQIHRKGKNLFPGGKQMRLIVAEDPWGSWGGMSEEPDAWQLDQVREEWPLVQSQILETGPERARLWTRWQGKQSWLELTFDICRGVPWVSVHGRLLWNERSARLQLVLPSSGPAVCDVPGSVTTRHQRGQVPIGRWFVRTDKRGKCMGVANDVLSDADFLPYEVRLTLARASRYANDVKTASTDEPWRPAVDCGELKFRLNLFSDGMDPDHVAEALTAAPVTLPVRPSPGVLPGHGSLGRLTPSTVRLLAAHRDASGRLNLRLQNRGKRKVRAEFYMGTRKYCACVLGPQQILQVTGKSACSLL